MAISSPLEARRWVSVPHEKYAVSRNRDIPLAYKGHYFLQGEPRRFSDVFTSGAIPRYLADTIDSSPLINAFSFESAGHGSLLCHIGYTWKIFMPDSGANQDIFFWSAKSYIRQLRNKGNIHRESSVENRSHNSVDGYSRNIFGSCVQPKNV